MNHFDGFVALVSIGVATWVWESSVMPWLDATASEILEWLRVDEESDDAAR